MDGTLTKKIKFAILVVVICISAIAIMVSKNNFNTAYGDTNTEKIDILNGASIRLSNTNIGEDNTSGIRFTGYVSDTYFTNETLNENVIVGMRIKVKDSQEEPKDYNSNGDSWRWAESDKLGFHKFNVVIYKIPQENYGTELEAFAYVNDGVNEYTTEKQIRSVARVATAAYSENIFTNKLDEDLKDKLTGFIQATNYAVMSNHIAIENGNITWKSGDNTVGYYIKLGEEVIHVLDTDINSAEDAYSLPLTSFTATEGLVDIIAYGDGISYSYSQIQDKNVYVVDERSDLLNGFTRGFLTTFNNGINGKLFDIEKTEEGYTVSVRSNGRRCVFGIALKEGLDLKNHAGLKIVFKVIQSDHTADTDKELDYGLQLVGKSITKNYTSSKYKFNCNLNEETIMYLTNEMLSEFYNEGDYQIALAQNLINCKSSDNFKINKFLIEEVSYYETAELFAPTNFAVSDAGVITRSSVDNASGYEVSINDNVYTTNTNSYTIADASAISYATIKVRAISSNPLYVNSDWTAEVNRYILAENELANFNNAIYTDNIVNIEGAWWGEKNGRNSWRTAPTYDDGTVKFGLYLDNYGTTPADSKLNAFKVSLPKGLDLTKAGITIKIQLYDKSSAVTPEYISLLEKNGNDTWCTTEPTTLPRISAQYQQWQEFTITSAELEAMGYETGDTELSFGVWNTVANNITVSYGMWVQIDYIIYTEG